MYITTCILNCAVINRLELPKFNPKNTQKYNGIPAKYPVYQLFSKFFDKNIHEHIINKYINTRIAKHKRSSSLIVLPVGSPINSIQ